MSMCPMRLVLCPIISFAPVPRAKMMFFPPHLFHIAPFVPLYPCPHFIFLSVAHPVCATSISPRLCFTAKLDLYFLPHLLRCLISSSISTLCFFFLLFNPLLKVAPKIVCLFTIQFFLMLRQNQKEKRSLRLSELKTTGSKMGCTGQEIPFQLENKGNYHTPTKLLSFFVCSCRKDAVF